MRAGGGDLDGAVDRLLACDFGEVEFVVGTVGEQIAGIDAQRVEIDRAFEKRDSLAEVADGDNLEAYLTGPIIAQLRQHPAFGMSASGASPSSRIPLARRDTLRSEGSDPFIVSAAHRSGRRQCVDQSLGRS